MRFDDLKDYARDVSRRVVDPKSSQHEVALRFVESCIRHSSHGLIHDEDIEMAMSSGLIPDDKLFNYED